MFNEYLETLREIYCTDSEYDSVDVILIGLPIMFGIVNIGWAIFS